jgi:dienelactone hydrolase
MVFRPPASMNPAYPRSVRDEEVRGTLRELLGVADPPDTVAYTVESALETEGVRTLRLSFRSMLGEAVAGVLIIPSTARAAHLPAVVCTPGTSGDAGLLADEQFRRDDTGLRQLRGWARELTRRGFATLSLTLHMNDARRGADEDFRRKVKFLAPYGITPMGLLVDEVLRGAQLLSAQESVDPWRIALAGFSLGGNATWYAFACARWLRAAASVCGGGGSLRRQIGEGDPARHSEYFYVPHLLRFFDHPTIVRACIVPRPLLVIAPTEDEDMPASGVEDLVREVQPAYERAGASGCFSIHRPKGRHEFREDYFEHVAAWLQEHL